MFSNPVQSRIKAIDKLVFEKKYLYASFFLSYKRIIDIKYNSRYFNVN